MDCTGYETTNVVYLSNFPRKLQKKELEELLVQYGPLLSLNIIYKNDFAFAFAEFDDIRDAVFAVKELNQKMFHGMNIKVQFRNKKIKSKEIEQEIKAKKQSLEQQQSPRSTLQTSCNIAPAKPRERSISSISRSPRRPAKRERQSVESDFSLSRSRSRSRTKRTRPQRNRDPIRPYRGQYGRQMQNSVQKYRQRRQEPRHSTHQSEIVRMYDMIRHFGKSLRRLEQRFEDLVYQHGQELRSQIRKRN